MAVLGPAFFLARFLEGQFPFLHDHWPRAGTDDIKPINPIQVYGGLSMLAWCGRAGPTPREEGQFPILDH